MNLTYPHLKNSPIDYTLVTPTMRIVRYVPPTKLMTESRGVFFVEGVSNNKTERVSKTISGPFHPASMHLSP